MIGSYDDVTKARVSFEGSGRYGYLVRQGGQPVHAADKRLRVPRHLTKVIRRRLQNQKLRELGLLTPQAKPPKPKTVRGTYRNSFWGNGETSFCCPECNYPHYLDGKTAGQMTCDGCNIRFIVKL